MTEQTQGVRGGEWGGGVPTVERIKPFLTHLQASGVFDVEAKLWQGL